MKNELPQDTDLLMAIAEDVAQLLSDKRDELSLTIDTEALLRASIAAATFAIDTYLAALADVTQSSMAQRFLPEAKRRCDRSVKQLRRRVSRSIAYLRRHMKDKDLAHVADYAVVRSR